MTSGFGQSGQSTSGGAAGFPDDFGTGGFSEFNYITGVPNGATADLLTYVVPVAKTLFLQMIEMGGDNIARYDVLVDGSPIAVARTWFNGPFIERIRFDGTGNVGILYPAGTTIKVTVTHFRQMPGAFEARITGVLK
jgi:hypothetical protein